ncbi:MAG: hypothetical protein JXO22_16400 [Phycisphaerae bacterium]|nr:hypothetical protein [Phycisphaerae bacterium]
METIVAGFAGCDLLLSDVNCDGVVDVFDIDAFVAALSEEPAQAWTYGYDDESRLVSAFAGVTPHNGCERQAYGYDYAGRRVWQATEEYVSGAWDTASPTELKRYIYDGRKIVMVLDGNMGRPASRS